MKKALLGFAVVALVAAVIVIALIARLNNAFLRAFPGVELTTEAQCDRVNTLFQEVPVEGSGRWRRLLAISDVHIGLGGGNDDAGAAARVAALVEQFADGHSELVLNGDTLELAEAAILVPGASARQHARAMAAVHPAFFAALWRWVASGNSLVFVIGNHDTALSLPEAQAEVVLAMVDAASRSDDPLAFPVLLLDPSAILGRVRFAHAYRSGPVYVAHGHQADPANRTARAGVHSEAGACVFDRTPGFKAIEFFAPLEAQAPWLDNVDRLDRIALGMAASTAAARLVRLVGSSTVPDQCAELGEAIAARLADRARGFSTLNGAVELGTWANALVSSLSTGQRLTRYAAAMVAGDPGIQVVLYGHTHDRPRVVPLRKGAWYANTGTWTPMNSSVSSCEAAERAWYQTPRSFLGPSPVVVIDRRADGSVEQPRVEWFGD